MNKNKNADPATGPARKKMANVLAGLHDSTGGPVPTLGELALSKALGAARLLGGLRGSREHRAAILASVLRRLLEAVQAVEKELRECA